MFLLLALAGGLAVFLTGGKELIWLHSPEGLWSRNEHYGSTGLKPLWSQESEAKGIILNNQPSAEKKPSAINEPADAAGELLEPAIVESDQAGFEIPAAKVPAEKTVLPKTGGGQVEQIQAVMLINGAEYRTAIKPDSSVYDLMVLLKNQGKVDFKVKNYSSLGFFIDEINGIKNDPAGLPAQAGKNWLYYVNGKPAPVGVSYYKLKNNDQVEWKYENKSF